jgi:pimeloyl-ACP methyl ester carboxylesterase
VHGLFADGSCWSEVIPRLQAVGLNVTSVQNPLTTLDEAVASAQRVLARQDGPTVLVGHSFSGMIVTEAGIDPKVSAVVYVAARAPDAGEDYAALAQQFPTPPATAGIVFDGDEGLTPRVPARFCRRSAGSESQSTLRGAGAIPQSFTGKTAHAAWRSKPSFYAVSTEDRPSIPIWSVLWRRHGRETIEVKATTFPSYRSPKPSRTSYWAAGRTPKAMPIPAGANRMRWFLGKMCCLDGLLPLLPWWRSYTGWPTSRHSRRRGALSV